MKNYEIRIIKKEEIEVISEFADIFKHSELFASK